MKCSICNKNMKMVGEIRYQKFIGGENGTYHQKLEVCSECGFVTTINPISNKELDYLYKDSNIYLDRKYKNFKCCIKDTGSYMDAICVHYYFGLFFCK